MKVRGAVAQVVNKRHVTAVAGYDPLWVLGSARRTEHGVSPVANEMLSRPAPRCSMTKRGTAIHSGFRAVQVDAYDIFLDQCMASFWCSGQ